jgi:hypothetical protein
VEPRCLATDLKRLWVACPALLLVSVASCASALDNQPAQPDAGAVEQKKPDDGKLTFPDADLTAKHEEATASPQSFAPVIAYAKAVADFCLATLVDTSCAPNCPKGAVKYKPMSELDPKNWVFTQDALTMLNNLKEVKGLPPAKFEQFVGVKGQLLSLAGHAEEERTLIDGYVEAHPDAIPIVRRRLERLREAGDVQESEAQCARSRIRMRSAPAPARREMLVTCVALHPQNKDGRTDQLDYTEYLPSLSAAEQRIYRPHLVQSCIEKVGSKETRCGEACACKEKGMDREQRAKCKAACRNCRITRAQEIRACKKTGLPTRAPRHAPRPGPAEPAAPAEPEVPKMVL